MEIQEIWVWFIVELLVQTFIFSMSRENSSSTKQKRFFFSVILITLSQYLTSKKKEKNKTMGLAYTGQFQLQTQPISADKMATALLEWAFLNSAVVDLINSPENLALNSVKMTTKNWTIKFQYPYLKPLS